MGWKIPMKKTKNTILNKLQNQEREDQDNA